MALVDIFSAGQIETSATSVRNESRLERVTVLALLLAPTVYLSVRHGIHVCVFVLLVLATVHMAKNPATYRRGLAAPWSKPLVFAFLALFLATAVTQALNLTLHWPAFDGPSRIMLCGAVFLFLRTRVSSFARAMEIGLPLGLLATALAILFNPNAARWPGRFATSFVDPNSLGSQSLILTLLCLFSIRLFGKEPPRLLLLKVIAVAVGLYITIHAQSRGGWAAIFPLLALWLLLQFSRFKGKGSATRRLSIALACAAIAALVIGYQNSSIISSRGETAYKDVTEWLDETNLDTSPGIRLSIWKISLSLAADRPWLGYGETGVKEVLDHHPLNLPAYRSAIEALAVSGPHSDILAKVLSMGLIGLFAYIATMAIPWTYFWRHRSDTDPDALAASHLGLYFITGVVVCGLTNEMLSLKYLCSFYGLIIAGLAADVAKREN